MTQVNYNILIDKLAHYRVRGIENNWFKTYLTNRKQHVTVSCQTSDNAFDRVLGPTGFSSQSAAIFDIHKRSKTRHKIQ